MPGAPRPAYPEPLRAAGIGGRVAVELVIDSTRRVRPGTVVVLVATHPLLEAAVRRTLPALRFLPARAQGHAVAQRARTTFELEVGK